MASLETTKKANTFYAERGAKQLMQARLNILAMGPKIFNLSIPGVETEI